MFKKSLCVILVIVTTMISSVCYVRADGGYSLSDLKNCTNIYSYSGKNNAYFYGNDKTLYYSHKNNLRNTILSAAEFCFIFDYSVANFEITLALF